MSAEHSEAVWFVVVITEYTNHVGLYPQWFLFCVYLHSLFFASFLPSF